jgi:hypothetical protein
MFSLSLSLSFLNEVLSLWFIVIFSGFLERGTVDSSDDEGYGGFAIEESAFPPESGETILGTTLADDVAPEYELDVVKINYSKVVIIFIYVGFSMTSSFSI